MLKFRAARRAPCRPITSRLVLDAGSPHKVFAGWANRPITVTFETSAAKTVRGVMNAFHKSINIFINCSALLVFSCAGAFALQEPQQPAPDNSKTNQRDRDKSSATADQQKMNPADREITQKIRSAITADKSLSTYAHNVKIITRDGKVTLKGPVRSDDEKSSIMSKATSVAGEGNVTDHMEVAPPKS